MNRQGASDPIPADAAVLEDFYPTAKAPHQSLVVPDVNGESIQELYNRCSTVLRAIIQYVQDTCAGESNILLCTHAATFVGQARVLSNEIPLDPTEADFVPYTACFTIFDRQLEGVQNGCDSQTDASSSSAVWECTTNGDCSFLKHGCERGWYVPRL